MKRPMQLSDLGEICVHISSFLDLPQISRCEVAAHFFPSKESVVFAWDEAAERIRHQVPVWGPSGHSVIHQLLEEGIRGKAFLRELRLLRRAIFPPKAWVPEVVEKSFCSAVVMPHDEQSSSFEDVKTPTEVAVPLTIGCYVGQALAVGMQVKIDASAADVDSAFCIGVEICAPTDVGTSMSVLFAPFSGLCFMQYRGEACVLSTPALPTLTGTGEVFSWANVCKDGSMYFLRESIEGEEKKVEATGILPREAFPKWASEYFVCAHVWRSYLPSPLEMSMLHSQQTLPQHLRSYIPEKHVDSTWHLLQS